MKRALLFLLGCCSFMENSCAGQGIEHGFRSMYASFIAAITTNTKLIRSTSPDSVTERFDDGQRNIFTTVKVVHQEKKKSDFKKQKVEIFTSFHSKDCPTPDLTLSQSKDDLSLMTPRDRSTSQDFGFYVEPSSPKISSMKRSDSFVSRPLKKSGKFSSFDSTTSSYNELSQIEEKKIAAYHLTPPVSPYTSSSPDKK
jgi:hypothetical protein